MLLFTIKTFTTLKICVTLLPVLCSTKIVNYFEVIEFLCSGFAILKLISSSSGDYLQLTININRMRPWNLPYRSQFKNKIILYSYFYHRPAL